MTAPIPKQVADVVLDQMNQLILVLDRFLPENDAHLVAWDQAVDRFLVSHPAHAQICLARIAHFQGDMENSEHFLNRALERGAPEAAVLDNAFMMYCNLLFARKAQEVGRKFVSIDHGNVREMFATVVSCGALSKAKDLLEQAKKAELDMNGVSQFARIKEIIAGMPVSQDLDLKLASVIDCAGEVVRSRKLFWLERAPRFSFDRSTGCMGIRYRVATSPTEAAQMTLEAADLVLARNLVDVPISIGFTGVKP